MSSVLLDFSTVSSQESSSYHKSSASLSEAKQKKSNKNINIKPNCQESKCQVMQRNNLLPYSIVRLCLFLGRVLSIWDTKGIVAINIGHKE